MTAKKHIICLIAVLALAILAGPGVIAAPVPSVVPPQGTWQFDIQFHGPPKKIILTLPGESQPRIYWYLLYTVTNNSGADIDFYPQFELFTDSFKLTAADVKPHRNIFDAIQNQYKKSIPLLEPSSAVTGTILQGSDNARDSVAVFADFDPNANFARIFISGLSNETVTIDHPTDIDPKTNKPRKVLLRKTLMLEYQIPGDAITPENRVMLYRGRQWIMR